MPSWVGVLGTSLANGGLAAVLASLTIPLGPMCSDCGGWSVPTPVALRVFELPAHVGILPVETPIPPVVSTDMRFRIDVDGACPGQPPVDRLPAIIGFRPVAGTAVNACLRVAADGRVDRIRALGRARAGVTAALQQLTLVPAMRDGMAVASWVEMRSGR
jgi:hypothetical protein